MASYQGAASEGGRAAHLRLQREKQKAETAARIKALEDETAKAAQMDDKFASGLDVIEQRVSIQAYGLVTLDQMKTIQHDAETERERQVAKGETSEGKDKKRKKKKKQSVVVSFDMEEGEEEEEGALAEAKRARLAKNPDVDTSFLPDKARLDEEAAERALLSQEWKAAQLKARSEKIEITYSFWDGSGHRRQIEMMKGDTIQQFLTAVIRQLRAEFHELRGVTAEQLVYVKEDLLIPMHYTFYDFIQTKARGKSGPLFNFDVHDDVRLVADNSVEKDESHAGKVHSSPLPPFADRAAPPPIYKCQFLFAVKPTNMHTPDLPCR